MNENIRGAEIEFIEERKDKIKSSIYNFWRKKEVQIFLDICRILLLVAAIIVIIILVINIQAVKLLNYDVCEICMNKTGATCFMPLK